MKAQKIRGERDCGNNSPLQRPTCGEIFRLVDLPHMRKVWKNGPADLGAPDWKHVPAEWRISWPKSGPVGWEGRVLGRKGHQTRGVLQSSPEWIFSPIRPSVGTFKNCISEQALYYRTSQPRPSSQMMFLSTTGPKTFISAILQYWHILGRKYPCC